MTTVDRFIANTPGLATAPVSFLKVDTEGHDAFVLKGAWKALEHKQIGMLAFEYGSHWNDTERESPLLSGVVADLDQLGYDSYLVGRKVMLQLNAGLWSYVYAEHPLINVMAILRAHPIKVGCAACVLSVDHAGMRKRPTTRLSRRRWSTPRSSQRAAAVDRAGAPALQEGELDMHVVHWCFVAQEPPLGNNRPMPRARMQSSVCARSAEPKCT